MTPTTVNSGSNTPTVGPPPSMSNKPPASPSTNGKAPKSPPNLLVLQQRRLKWQNPTPRFPSIQEIHLHLRTLTSFCRRGATTSAPCRGTSLNLAFLKPKLWVEVSQSRLWLGVALLILMIMDEPSAVSHLKNVEPTESILRIIRSTPWDPASYGTTSPHENVHALR